MAIRVTEKWSERKMSLQWPWRGRKRFQVTGTTDEVAALSAVDPSSGVKIPQRNDGWVDGSSLLCRGPSVNARPGLSHWIIDADFEIPNGGLITGDPNPLLAPIILTPEEMEITEPIDIDIDNRPIRNAAGDVMQGASRTISLMVWTFQKNYPFWNEQWHDLYVNSVNRDVVVIGGIRYPAQHAKCLSVKPAGQFQANAPFIPVTWKFAVVPDGLIGPYPWQYRFANAGTQGWYADGGTNRKARFTSKSQDGSYDAVSDPIYLDITGKPMAWETGYTVGKGGTPIENPNSFAKASSDYASDGDYYSYLISNSCGFLIYKRCVLTDWSQIPI